MNSEQYPTEGDLAAFFVLAIDQLDHLENKHVVDLGAGNGILGIGCTYLGSNKVTMIEGDLEVAKTARQNSLEIMTKNNCRIEVIDEMITSDMIAKLKMSILLFSTHLGDFKLQRLTDQLLIMHSVSNQRLSTLFILPNPIICLKLVMNLAMTAKLYSKVISDCHQNSPIKVEK